MYRRRREGLDTLRREEEVHILETGTFLLDESRMPTPLDPEELLALDSLSASLREARRRREGLDALRREEEVQR